jgi:hypothetical protein
MKGDPIMKKIIQLALSITLAATCSFSLSAYAGKDQGPDGSGGHGSTGIQDTCLEAGHGTNGTRLSSDGSSEAPSAGHGSNG